MSYLNIEISTAPVMFTLHVYGLTFISVEIASKPVPAFQVYVLLLVSLKPLDIF